MDPKNRLNEDASAVNNNIARVRRRPGRLRDERVTLAHGAGGKSSAALLEHVFYRTYGNDLLAQSGDSTILPGGIGMSTDSYVVNPIIFPGGSIGELAVNGTVNDLAVSGAVPRWLTISFIVEEGLEIATLRRIAEDARAAAEAAGVELVAGDTKVVPQGAADGLYLTTSGVGFIPNGRDMGFHQVKEGDAVVLSGPIADHGMAVMLARGELALDADISSDTREVASQVAAMIDAAPHARWMRDATRGGLATVLNELAEHTGFAVIMQQEDIMVRDVTRAACDVLGIDPLYVANEGTFCAVVPAEEAEAAAAAVPGARVVGRIAAQPESSVVLVNGFGGSRMVDKLAGDPLPRIC